MTSLQSDAAGGLAAAVEAGRAALRGGDRVLAVRWLERAARLSPRSDSVAFLLASALASRDNGRSLALLRGVAARQPSSRAVRIALVAAASRAGLAEEAGLLLGDLLRSFVAPDEAGFIALCDQVCAAIDAAGWCGGMGDGRLLASVQPAMLRRSLRIGRGGAAAAVVRPCGTRVSRVAISGEGAVRVQAGQAVLLGSGFDPASWRSVQGCVEVLDDGSLRGWAIRPADPDAVVPLRLIGLDGAERVVVADDVSEMAGEDELVVRRGFRVAAPALPAGACVRVCGPDGAELAGSPLRLEPMQGGARATAALLASAYPVRGAAAVLDVTERRRPMPASGAAVPGGRAVPRRRAVDVVVPVFRGADDLERCLASLRRDLPGRARVVVVDDGSRDPALLRLLARLEREGVATVLRHGANLGFPAAANTGMRHAASSGPRDVLLLNPDTLVPRRLLQRLAAVAYGSGDVGSVTPLSSDGTLVSYPRPGTALPIADMDAADRMDGWAESVHGAGSVVVPTAVGFCMYVRHDCLAEVGVFRDDAFAQGYGEENDWSLRARHLGWAHVAAPGVFVAHAGGRSFGAAKQALLARNGRVLERLHPGYDAMIAAAGDPMAGARRAMDAARWPADGLASGSVVLISHALGGGVQRFLTERCGQLRAQGLRPLVVTPVPGGCAVSDTAEVGATNLVYRLPQDWTTLLALLGGDRARWVELHHTLGHDPALLGLAERMGLPFDVFVHDYHLWCPRITLCGLSRQYCGEPALSACEACVQGLDGVGADGVAGLRARSAALLQGARRVFVPSADTGTRAARWCPDAPLVLTPWEAADTLLPVRPDAPAAGAGRDGIVVVVPGAIGVDKGYDVLLRCGWDAAHRDLPLRFVVAGHTMDDGALLRTGRMFVTGEYAESEAVELMRAQEADFGFIPSVWPETWCYTLSALWRGGLEVASFDLGAQGERIQRSGRGITLPLGLPTAALNDRLVQYGRMLRARAA